MPTKKRSLFAIPLISLMLFGCVLLSPPSLTLPTPIPTAPPLEESLNIEENNQVVDPISDVVPRPDPDIQTLVNVVSQQQLIAYVQQLEGFYTRNAFSVASVPDRGIAAAGTWIHDEFQRVGEGSNGRLQVRYEEFPLSYQGFSATQNNIIAELPGTIANGDVIVIMAHYDTRPVDETDGFSQSPGANDNASGVALLLETARLLSSRGWNQTIIFAALSAEEQGTFGAKNLVQRLIQDGRNVVAAVNYDTVGGRVGIPQSVRLFAPELYQSGSGELARYYDYNAGLYLPTFPVTVINSLDREGRYGDQREFYFAQMPAIRLTESQEDPDMVNSIRDRWDTLDYSYLQKVTQINVAVVASMAGAPPKPAPPVINNMATPGSFLLTWEPDPLAAGYAISFRPLSSEGYPLFRFVSAADAGQVVLNGYDVNQPYAVSIAAIDNTGRLSLFSTEVIIASTQ